MIRISSHYNPYVVHSDRDLSPDQKLIRNCEKECEEEKGWNRKNKGWNAYPADELRKRLSYFK